MFQALQSALSVYTNYTGKTQCLDISSAYDSSMGDAQWNFQVCEPQRHNVLFNNPLNMLAGLYRNGDANVFRRRQRSLRYVS